MEPTASEIRIELNSLKELFHNHSHRGYDQSPQLGASKTVHIKVVDDLTAAATGDGKFIFMIPQWWDGMRLIGCHAYVTGASSSGALTIQLRNVTDSVDMLSTALTIDVSELSSLTAATPAVININNADVSSGDQIAIDVDSSGTSSEGLGVILLFS